MQALTTRMRAFLISLKVCNRQPLGQLEDVQPLAVTDVQVGPGVEKEDGDVVMFSDDCEVEGRVTLAVNMIRVRPLLQQLLYSQEAARPHGLEDVGVHQFKCHSEGGMCRVS